MINKRGRYLEYCINLDFFSLFFILIFFLGGGEVEILVLDYELFGYISTVWAG
jgi:hypothetical protein